MSDYGVAKAACLLRGALTRKWDLSREEFQLPAEEFQLPSFTRVATRRDDSQVASFKLNYMGRLFRVAVEEVLDV